MSTLEDQIVRYLGAREQQRQQEIENAYPQLEAALTAFAAEHRDDPGLPVLLARMIHEVAVTGFVRGTMFAAGKPFSQIRQPRDVEMLHAALETLRSVPDLYPAFAFFDGRVPEDEELGDEQVSGHD